jgi:hypothetical protein
MKILRLIPVVIGVAILLFGIYLVSTNGYFDGRYLPSLIGIQPCSSGSSNSAPNGTGCSGFTLYGGLGVGTIVCIFGLGLIASSIRRAVATPSTSGVAVPPEMLAAFAQAQSRPQVGSGAVVPGVKPGTVYCSKCGAANPWDAKFCHQCASPMPAKTPPVSRSGPPDAPPGAGP